MDRSLSNLDDLAAYITELGPKPLTVPGGLSVPARLGDRAAEIEVRWLADQALLRAELRVPIEIPASRRHAVHERIARINDEIALLGFVPDDEGVSFVAAAVLEPDGTISSRTAYRTIRLCAEEAGHWLETLVETAREPE